MRIYEDPLVLEMVYMPKTLVADQPSTFTLNLFHKNATWLWHSDFDIFIKNANTGQVVLSMPNQHGHGSMIQFSPVFPSAGLYDINIIYGQQVNSPNYIKPHYVRGATFQVQVQPSSFSFGSQSSLNQANGNNNNNNATNMTNTTANDSSTLIPPSFTIPTVVNNSTANQMATTVASANNNSSSINRRLLITATAATTACKRYHNICKVMGVSPNKIEVNKGDLVRLHFITANDEVSLYNGHGFGIDGYNINTFLVKGIQQTLQFVADKPGTFMFRCTSFCAFPDANPMNHFNMLGSFIVHG